MTQLERIYAALDAAGWDAADQPTGEQIEVILAAAALADDDPRPSP